MTRQEQLAAAIAHGEHTEMMGAFPAIRRRCRQDNRFWTAMHEACHAVFALRLRVPFERVVVFDFARQIPAGVNIQDFGDYDEGGLVTHEGAGIAPEVSALVALAGVAFEGWMHNKDDASQRDFELAVEAVGRKPMATLCPRASRMLMDEFDSIVRLGEELYRSVSMTEQECHAIRDKVKREVSR